MAGYEKLAGLMTKHSEVATFQRFNFLNILNILYLQAELVHLEEELRESMRGDLEASSNNTPSRSGRLFSASDRSDAGREENIESREETNNEEEIAEKRPISQIEITPDVDAGERMKSARDWYFLSNLSSSKSSTWETMLRARSKLKEYNEAILQQTDLRSRDSPNPCDLDFLRRWFTDSRMGDFPLIGRDSFLWADSLPADLIALRARKAEDPLGTWFLRRVYLWWHHCVGYRLKKPLDEEAQYFEYSDKSVLRVASVVSSVLSSGLLAGSILALYFVDDMLVRLGIIVAFTQVFSLVLVLATSARKVEVFAATAAFVAVQVVFVGGTYTP